MTETGDELPPEVREALARGRRIEAIKLLRETRGLGLREARRLVQAGERRQLQEQAPRRGSVSSGSGIGRLAVVTAIVIGAVAAYRLLT